MLSFLSRLVRSVGIPGFGRDAQDPEAAPMLLLVGLGNPGAEYARNRHNVGFMAVDRIHARHGFGPWRKKFQAEVADGMVAGERVLLMKPQTFMNLSGNAVGEAVRFLKIDPADVIVAHDEIDLPPGKFRLKTGGGHGGHNGLRSITPQIGDGYRRLRIGIGHPGHKDRVPGYVLHDFGKAETEWLEPLLDAFAENADLLVAGEDSKFANKVHRAVAPPDDLKPAKSAAKKPTVAAGGRSAPAAADLSREREQACDDDPRPTRDPGGPFDALARLIGRNR